MKEVTYAQLVSFEHTKIDLRRGRSFDSREKLAEEHQISH